MKTKGFKAEVSCTWHFIALHSDTLDNKKIHLDQFPILGLADIWGWIISWGVFSVHSGCSAAPRSPPTRPQEQLSNGNSQKYLHTVHCPLRTKGPLDGREPLF